MKNKNKAAAPNECSSTFKSEKHKAFHVHTVDNLSFTEFTGSLVFCDADKDEVPHCYWLCILLICAENVICRLLGVFAIYCWFVGLLTSAMISD
jgi:hypothetical protein